MLTDQEIKNYLANMPKNTDPEVWRYIASCLSGIRDNLSAKEVSSYYNVPIEFSNNFYETSNFSIERKVRGSRKEKNNKIFDYLKSNIGKTITPKDFCDTLEVSLPTFYNFFNANRGWFKKVKRGQFEIINEPENRVSVK